MKKRVFTGAGTALIIPMSEEGIDIDSFGRHVDWQIENGTDALIVAATTGEGPTLDDAEHKSAIEFVVDRAAGKVPVIAGTGSNDTAYGLQLTRAACQMGVDGVLVVTPYYNKATQDGLIRMYNTYADASTVPLIIYNVPSRTGCNVEPATYAQLAKHENIVATKEANNNIAKIVETKALCGDNLDIYSGNDDQVIPLLSIGGIGVISVLSNIAPMVVHNMVMEYLEGDQQKAVDLQLEYTPLIKALFSEVNPIPVKAAASAMGFGENYLRSPMYPISEKNEKVLLEEMRKVGLLA